MTIRNKVREYTKEEIQQRYPLFNSDLYKHRVAIIKISLRWRMNQGKNSGKNFSCRAEAIKQYMDYIEPEYMSSVRRIIRSWFFDHRSDNDFQEFWKEPALAHIFKDIDKMNDSLRTVLLGFNDDDCIESGYEVRDDVVNTVTLRFNGLSFDCTNKIKSNDHFFNLIEAVRRGN